MKRFISLILSATMFMSALSIQTVFATNISTFADSTSGEDVTIDKEITPNTFYKSSEIGVGTNNTTATCTLTADQETLYKSFGNGECILGETTTDGSNITLSYESNNKWNYDVTKNFKITIDSDGDYSVNCLGREYAGRALSIKVEDYATKGATYSKTLSTLTRDDTAAAESAHTVIGKGSYNIAVFYGRFTNLTAGDYIITISYAGSESQAQSAVQPFAGLNVFKIGEGGDPTPTKPGVEAGPLVIDTYYNAAQLFDSAISTTDAEDKFTMSNSQKNAYDELGNNIFGTPETSGEDTIIKPEYKMGDDIPKKEIDVDIDNDGEYSVYLLAREYNNRGYKVTISNDSGYTETIQTDVASGGNTDTNGQIRIGTNSAKGSNIGVHYAKFNLTAGKYKLTLEGAERQTPAFYGLNIRRTGDYVQQPTKPGVEEGPLETGKYYNAAQLFDSATKTTADTYTVNDEQKTAYEGLGTEVFGALETSGNDTTITPEYKVENGIAKKEIKVNVTEAGKYSVYLLARQYSGQGYKITMADGKDYTETLQTDVIDGSSTDTNGQIMIGSKDEGKFNIGVHYAQFNLAAGGEYTLTFEGAAAGQPDPFYGLNIVKKGDYVKPVDPPETPVKNVTIKDENVTLSEDGTLSYTLTLPEEYNSETTNYFVVLRNNDVNDSFIGVNANGPLTGKFTGLNSGSTYKLKVYTWNNKMQPIGDTFIIEEVKKTTTTE